MKRISGKYLFLLVSVSLLSACSTEQDSGGGASSNSSSVSNSQTQKSSEQKSSETTTSQEQSVWTQQRATNLQQFMASWGNEMGQKYQEYSLANNVNFYGLSIPKGLLEEEMYPQVANQRVKMSWIEQEVSKEGYTILTVYSDIEENPSMARHCYLFTMYKEQPVILVTTQNQGNEENTITFTETENQALKKGFNQIMTDAFVAEENGSSTEATSNTQEFSEDTKENLQKLKGTYVKKGEEDSAFIVDDSYYTDVINDKKYKIISIYFNPGTKEFSIAWDIEEFEQRYGKGSAGQGPQAIMYKEIGRQGTRYIVEDMVGQSYIRK